jgi:hypothetical protein
MSAPAVFQPPPAAFHKPLSPLFTNKIGLKAAWVLKNDSLFDSRFKIAIGLWMRPKGACAPTPSVGSHLETFPKPPQHHPGLTRIGATHKNSANAQFHMENVPQGGMGYRNIAIYLIANTKFEPLAQTLHKQSQGLQRPCGGFGPTAG